MIDFDQLAVDLADMSRPNAMQTESDCYRAMSKALRQLAADVLEEAARYCDQREAASNKAADDYDKRRPGDRYWGPSERCAAREAGHIAAIIRTMVKP
jgi:hypothetical protein